MKKKYVMVHIQNNACEPNRGKEKGPRLEIQLIICKNKDKSEIHRELEKFIIIVAPC